MEGAQQNSTVAALDIGTSKISVAVGEIGPDGELSILGFGKVGANGIHAGSVQDVQQVIEAVREAVAEAEQTSQRRITMVSAALTGKHLHSINNVGRQVLQDGEIDSNSVKRATRLALTFDPKKHANSEDDRVVMHVIQGYTIDNDDTMLDDPVGMAGNVLKAHAHLAIGSDSIVRNLISCIRRAELDMEYLLMQPWASAEATVTITEKELGVIVLDVGAGAIDVACYIGGHIRYTAVVPMGGEIITRDIAAGLGCSLEDAEEIKITYGHVGVRAEDAYERIRYMHEPTKTEKTITSAELEHIIRARCEETLRMVGAIYLNQDQWLTRAAAGVVLTGGVTRMPGFKELTQAVLNLPVRIGLPPMQRDSALGLVSPEDATVVGLLLETVKRRSTKSHIKTGSSNPVLSFFKRMIFGDFA